MMRMKELREFLHYLVLLPRATLPFDIPFDIFSKLLQTAICMNEAKDILDLVKKYSSPLLQAKHKVAVKAESFKFTRIIQKPNKRVRSLRGEDLLSSFIELHSDLSESVNVSHLFCTRMQKTVDASGRVNSLQDREETLRIIW